MLLVSLDATLPESHRSAFSSSSALDATRTSYAVWRPPDRRQLSSGVASLSPIGFVCVSTRSVVAVTLPGTGSARAEVLIVNGTAPTTTTRAAAHRPGFLGLKCSPP